VSPWDPEQGTVSRAFDDWQPVDADIRSFLDKTVQWVTAAHNAAWTDAETEARKIFDPERHETDLPVHLYMGKVSRLWPDDHLWMINAAALRDAVTAFEVYLEKSANEVISPCGYKFKLSDGRDSPNWWALVKVHRSLGNNVDTRDVRYVRDLRHLLTHQRGELRTSDLRKKFSQESSDSFRDYSSEVPLSQPRVVELMDLLARTVKVCDPKVWEVCYWGAESPDLEPLASGRNHPLTRIEAH
jgi:hypothetical protein